MDTNEGVLSGEGGESEGKLGAGKQHLLFHNEQAAFFLPPY